MTDNRTPMDGAMDAWLAAHPGQSAPAEVVSLMRSVVDAITPLIAADPGLLRQALELIGTDCANYTGGDTSCVNSGRSPYAEYGAGRWCDQCIARTALSGGTFPTN